MRSEVLAASAGSPSVHPGVLPGPERRPVCPPLHQPPLAQSIGDAPLLFRHSCAGALLPPNAFGGRSEYSCVPPLPRRSIFPGDPVRALVCSADLLGSHGLGDDAPPQTRQAGRI